MASLLGLKALSAPFLHQLLPKKANKTANMLFQFLKRSPANKKTFRDENIKIFHCLQILLTKMAIARLCFSGLALVTDFLPLYQVFIYKTNVFSQLY